MTSTDGENASAHAQPHQSPGSAADNERVNGRQHVCTHDGCSKAFGRKSDLLRHERIHTGEKPFKCDRPGCDRAFVQRSALTVHVRTHTGEKPHQCDICSRSFSDSSSLARHRRIHTCDKSFARKVSLVNHVDREHSTEALTVDVSLRSLDTPRRPVRPRRLTPPYSAASRASFVPSPRSSPGDSLDELDDAQSVSIEDKGARGGTVHQPLPTPISARAAARPYGRVGEDRSAAAALCSIVAGHAPSNVLLPSAPFSAPCRLLPPPLSTNTSPSSPSQRGYRGPGASLESFSLSPRSRHALTPPRAYEPRASSSRSTLSDSAPVVGMSGTMTGSTDAVPALVPHLVAPARRHATAWPYAVPVFRSTPLYGRRQLAPSPSAAHTTTSRSAFFRSVLSAREHERGHRNAPPASSVTVL